MSINLFEKLLIKEFLNSYSDVLSSDGCNDWEFPTYWDLAMKNKFIEEYHIMNGSIEDYKYSINPIIGNMQAVDLLAYKLHGS